MGWSASSSLADPTGGARRWTSHALGSRIGRRVLASFVACAVLPLAGLAALSYFSLSARLHGEADDALRSETKATGSSLAERLLALEADLDLVRGAVRDDGTAALARLPDEVRTRIARRFDAIVLAQGGRRVLLAGRGFAAGAPSAEQERHLAAGGTWVTSAESGAGVVFVQRVDRNDPSRGELAARVAHAELWDIDGVKPLVGELLVFDAGGGTVFATGDAEPAQRALVEALRHEPASGRLEWHAAAGDREAHVGRYWRLFLRPRFQLEWLVVHGRPRSLVLGALRDFQHLFVSTTLASFLLVLALSLILIRRTLGPIAQLHAATCRVATGDLTARVEIERADEFGALGRSFNAMTEQLVENIARREQTERDLVAACNAALAAARTEAALLTNVSHELRTPVTGILSSAEILQQFGDADPAARRDFTDVIVEQARRLARLVDDVLEMSRLQDDGARLELAATPLATSIAQAVDGLPAAQRARIELRVADDLPPVLGDAAYLPRLWFHLIDNALKFSEPTAPVTVRAQRDGHNVVVEVEDHGVGIAAADQEVIFERFRQVGRDILTEKAVGIGMGLALAKSIVQRHHGCIEVTSRVGQGSTFRVVLPAASLAPA